jgi:hypothetical protein
MTEKTEAQVYLGLFIAIPVAIAINIILAIVGGRWMNKLSHKSGEDVLTAHYLGGRSFGTWVTFGTMVSTNLILPESFAFAILLISLVSCANSLNFI